MKKLIIFCSLLMITSALWAQTPDYKVIFDITSKDTVNHKAVVRQAGGIAKGNPGAQLEVAIYSEALDMVLKDRSVVAKQVQELAESKKVAFKVCAMTMKRHNIDKSQLVPGVEVVPDAIYEIITKQKEGWGYIKVGQ